MSAGRVDVSEPVPDVVVVTLDRPEKLNALTGDMVERIIAIAHATNSDGTRAVILTGRGRAFSAGGDVRALVSMASDEIADYLGCYGRLDDAISDSGALWIAAVNGLAYGGGLEIAAMCDVRVADSGATFCVADIEVGALPTGGLTWKLPRMVGAGAASWMVLTNAVVDTQRALTMSLIDEVTEQGGSLARSLALANKVKDFHPDAIRANRVALRQGWTSSLVEAKLLEVAESVRLLGAEDVMAPLRHRYGDRER